MTRSQIDVESDINITHHEHRAPTDQSVKIMREMEAQIKASIVERYTTKSNSLVNTEVTVFYDPATREKTLTISFNLNGKVVQVDLPFNDRTSMDTAFFTWVNKKLAEAITEHVLRGLSTQDWMLLK